MYIYVALVCLKALAPDAIPSCCLPILAADTHWAAHEATKNWCGADEACQARSMVWKMPLEVAQTDFE